MSVTIVTINDQEESRILAAEMRHNFPHHSVVNLNYGDDFANHGVATLQAKFSCFILGITMCVSLISPYYAIAVFIGLSIAGAIIIHNARARYKYLGPLHWCKFDIHRFPKKHHVVVTSDINHVQAIAIATRAFLKVEPKVVHILCAHGESTKAFYGQELYTLYNPIAIGRYCIVPI